MLGSEPIPRQFCIQFSPIFERSMLSWRFLIFAHLSLYEPYVGEDAYVSIVTKPKRAQMHKSILYYKHTYLLIPQRRALLEKVTGSQLVKKFPSFYGTRRFITAITSAHQLSLTWANILRILCLNYKILLHIYVHSFVSLPYRLVQITVMDYTKPINALRGKRYIRLKSFICLMYNILVYSDVYFMVSLSYLISSIHCHGWFKMRMWLWW